MEPLLTLLIAVGGIATGVGAIWAAVVARRQAQLTELSLSEQGQSLREQNERTRLSLEADLLDRLDERFSSERLLDRRRRVAKYIKNNFLTEDGELLEVRHLNNAASEVFHFFEVAGQLAKAGAVEAETVFTRYGWWIWSYWTLCRPAIEKQRETLKDEEGVLWGDFESLYQLSVEFERQRYGTVEHLTKEELRWFVETEAVVGEERGLDARAPFFE